MSKIMPSWLEARMLSVIEREFHRVVTFARRQCCRACKMVIRETAGYRRDAAAYYHKEAVLCPTCARAKACRIAAREAKNLKAV